ncbi:MAG: hypothetical protein QNJ16_19685 [Rhodobacter sp.]|nr:hypothetical protein [Rhodobacter sp.]
MNDSKYKGSPTYHYIQAKQLVMEKMGLNLEIDPFAGEEFCFHNMYLAKPPQEEAGLTYPDGFKWWKFISREELPEVEFLLGKFLAGCSDDHELQTVEPLFPIFDIDLPPKQIKRLQTIIKRMLRLNPHMENSRGICIIPEEDSDLWENYVTSPDLPKAFLPPKSWFSPELQELDETDILTIFQKPERTIYTLTIGRALVGPSGVTHAKTDLLINHTWRTAPVVTGMPGIGKSTITKSLAEALETVGYKVASFTTLNKQFGLSDIITADLAYADDLNNKTFQDYIESPVIKQAITGGKLRTEKKFLDEVQTMPSAAFLCNINDFDINVTYKTDDGVLDRLKILNCTMPSQFNSRKKKLKGISRFSPCLHPVPHLKWLCQELGCSQNALMLRFARICVDKFLAHLEDGSLEDVVNQATCDLDVQLHKHYDKVLAMVFQLCYILRRDKEYNADLPDFKPLLLSSSIRATQYVVLDDMAFWVREEIKNDWKEKSRPSYHPWTGIKLLEVISLDNAVKDYDANAVAYADKDIKQCVETIFKALRLNQGYNVPANLSQVTRAWEGSKRQYNSLLSLAERVRKNVDKTVLDSLQSGCKAETEYIRDESYNRQRHADELRKRGKGGLAKTLSGKPKTNKNKPKPWTVKTNAKY